MKNTNLIIQSKGLVGEKRSKILRLVRVVLSIFISILVTKSFSQLKLSEIPFDLNVINKSNLHGKQSVWFFYDKNDSTVFAMQHFVNDTLHGYFERYWYNGLVSEKGYYYKGALDSIFIAYWEDGTVRGEAYYSLGKLNGVVTSYSKSGKLTSRFKYVDNVKDSNYLDNYLDPDMTWDKVSIKMDTLIQEFSGKWNKKLGIYKNDSLFKEINYFKDRIGFVNYYKNGVNIKREIYSRKKRDNYIERVFYYTSNGTTDKVQYFDKNGVLIREEKEVSETKFK